MFRSLRVMNVPVLYELCLIRRPPPAASAPADRQLRLDNGTVMQEIS